MTTSAFHLVNTGQHDALQVASLEQLAATPRPTQAERLSTLYRTIKEQWRGRPRNGQYRIYEDGYHPTRVQVFYWPLWLTIDQGNDPDVLMRRNNLRFSGQIKVLHALPR